MIDTKKIFRNFIQNDEAFDAEVTSSGVMLSEDDCLTLMDRVVKNIKEDNSNEQLRASELSLLNALTAITNNIDEWLESGEPADKETSKKLYDDAKIAINKATGNYEK